LISADRDSLAEGRWLKQGLLPLPPRLLAGVRHRRWNLDATSRRVRIEVNSKPGRPVLAQPEASLTSREYSAIV
jgi:hypothetical protein